MYIKKVFSFVKWFALTEFLVFLFSYIIKWSFGKESFLNSNSSFHSAILQIVILAMSLLACKKEKIDFFSPINCLKKDNRWGRWIVIIFLSPMLAFVIHALIDGIEWIAIGYGLDALYADLIHSYKGVGFSDIIWIAIVPAICEELFYRYFGCTLLEKKPLGVWITTAAFALAHLLFLSNRYRVIETILFSLMLSLLLGYLYIKTENLLLCMLVHFMYNLFTVVIQSIINLPTSSGYATYFAYEGYECVLIGSIIAIIAVAIGTACLLIIEKLLTLNR